MVKNYSRKNKHFGWRTIFQAHSGGFSSKRIFGAIGMIICLVILTVAFITEKPVPDFAELVYVTSASLLGLDNITDIFTKNVNISN